MAWIFLVGAGLFEVAWAAGLKESHGLTRPLPTAFMVVTMAISFILLSAALKTLPIGTAYAVWVGIGAVGTALLGILFLNEPATPGRVAFLGLLIVAIVGLKATSGEA